jgi:hypothetical protein
MVIELEPAKPNFARRWVTGGTDEFRAEAHRWKATHAHCVRNGLHLDLEWSDGDDGIHRMWFFCDCGSQALVLGPLDGRPMSPIFLRMQ